MTVVRPEGHDGFRGLGGIVPRAFIRLTPRVFPVPAFEREDPAEMWAVSCPLATSRFDPEDRRGVKCLSKRACIQNRAVADWVGTDRAVGVL